jgi:Tfp pilus assembly protein PilW
VACRARDERGATSLPELIVVMVTSIVVLGAILLALESSTTVAARTEARSSDLTDINRAMRVVTQDVRGAYMIAPADPASPSASVDGVSLLVQANDGSASDPRVWVTYRCGAGGAGPRACTRTVNAAQSSGVVPAGELPAMQQDASGRFVRGAQIGEPVTIVRNLYDASGAAPVFALGWAEDAAPVASCTTEECVSWHVPSAAPAGTLDGRAVFRRSATDARPPLLRVALQVRSGRSRTPVGTTAALSPRGCVDPSLPTDATITTQVDC